MIIRILTFALLTFSFLVTVAPAQAQRPLPTPKLMAVYFYSDWCPNCQILSPVMEEARKTGGFDRQDIVFVTLDLSDKDKIHQSILLAQALGIGDFMKAQGSGTGYVAILDATTKEELTRFDRTHQSAVIVTDLQSRLQP
jgi:thiol-disulfide isomerase/thioredoxin